jgi:hypothetical protein
VELRHCTYLLALTFRASLLALSINSLGALTTGRRRKPPVLLLKRFVCDLAFLGAVENNEIEDGLVLWADGSVQNLVFGGAILIC